MALIRGLRGLFPCPVCLIPGGHLSDILGKYVLRVASEIREKVEKIETKTQKEKVLSAISIRAVRVSSSFKICVYRIIYLVH